MRSCMLAVALGLILPSAAPGLSAGLDSHTTFLARYERGVAPEYCRGNWQAAYGGPPALVPGRIGKALALGPRQRIVYPADGKINPRSGTIEFWLKCTWQPGTNPRLTIITFRTPTNCYLNFNTISPTRLGMAIQGGPADAHVWRRVDADPSQWSQGDWHHVAGTWDNRTLRLYVDGRLVQEVTDAAPMVDAPAEFSVGPGPLVIDELRISDTARTANELRQSMTAGPAACRCIYLTDLPPAAAQETMGRIAIDEQRGFDDRRLPLAVGRTAYARGIGLRAPGWVEFQVPKGFDKLVARVGASTWGDRPIRIRFAHAGRVLAETPPLRPGDDATPVTVPLPSGGKLRIECLPAGDTGGLAAVADAVLLRPGAEPPSPFSRPLSDLELTIQRMRTDVAKFSFPLADDGKGYAIYADHPIDILDPSAGPGGEKFPRRLTMQAAAGEWEAVQFAIFAARDITRMRVSCSALRSGAQEIDRRYIQVRLVRRVLQRRGYWMKREPDNYDVVSRFLFPNRVFWLPKGHFKQVNVTVHMPERARPGAYRGTITVALEGLQASQIELVVHVPPIKLLDPPARYGMYYDFPRAAHQPEVLNAELADMAAHGCTTMVPHVGLQFEQSKQGGPVQASYEQIRQCLTVLRRHGFHGPIVIGDGIFSLARVLGVSGLDDKGGGKPLADNEQLCRAMRQALEGLQQVARDFPEFELLLTHMDEVFTPKRIARFIDAARVVRQGPHFRFYETMHMMPGRWEDYMKRADDYIDVRCINGHSLDEWLKSGHTFAELAAMLKASGDEGWTYYNMRGSFFIPEWNRIVNGLYMWTSPLTTHVPWMYYSYGGNPFDDTDSRRYDFGYAFPSDSDPTQLISTLHWEAFREGYDDMRYFATLEALARRAEKAGVSARSARQWLTRLRAMMPRTPQDIADIDLESPVLVWLSRRLTGADWDRMRQRTAQEIAKLQRALGQ